MRSAVLFLCLQGHVPWLLWVQLLTECTSSLSSMSRVIVFNSSYFLLTVFCHLVRQPSCQVAFPHGYFSNPLNQFDVKMPQDLRLRKSAYCFVLFWYLSQWGFSIPKLSLQNWFQPFFWLWHGSNLKVMSSHIFICNIWALISLLWSDLAQKTFQLDTWILRYSFWTAFVRLVMRIKLWFLPLPRVCVLLKKRKKKRNINWSKSL